jgi:hypothetical protein
MDFEYDGLQGGKPYWETGSVRFLAADQMRAASSDYVGGELASSMDVMLQRR